MEQVAPVTPSRATWQRTGLKSGGVLLLALAVALNARLLWWAASTLALAPLALVAAFGLLVLPGLALLRLLWLAPLPAAERWPLAIGLSCALPPFLLLLSEPLGLRWDARLCWGYVALALLVVLWPRRRARPSPATYLRAVWTIERPHLLLLIITFAALLVRLFAARDLPVGLFGDSYHHTLIAQLLIDHGGLFSSWEPYAPLATLTYHFGFHSTVAWFSLLSGVPVTRSLVLVGQVESALAAPMVYLLAQRTLRSEHAALWAALLVGVVGTMPSYYVNWGRYTQIAGQTVLPAACVVWMALLKGALIRPLARGALARLVTLTAIATAGLILTHYRIAVFAACFVAAYGLWVLVGAWGVLRDEQATKPRPRTQKVKARAAPLARLAAAGGAAGGAALLLVTPWLLRLRQGALLRIGGQMTSKNMGTDQSNALPDLDQILALHARTYLVVLALLGVALLVRARAWGGLVLVGWAALVVVTANPYMVGLNGAGILTNFAVLIANYLVLAPLAGAALALMGAWVAGRWNAARPVALAQVALGALLLLGNIGWQQQIVEPHFQLFTPADAKAMDWIKRETAPDARFFVNAATAYSGSLYVGTDGGWWLPFMSGRASNLPPLTYGSEAGEQPGYFRQVNQLNALLQKYPVGSAETAVALKAGGFTYLYDGPAAEPANEYIDRARVGHSAYYKRVYRSEGVTIWKVK